MGQFHHCSGNISKQFDANVSQHRRTLKGVGERGKRVKEYDTNDLFSKMNYLTVDKCLLYDLHLSSYNIDQMDHWMNKKLLKCF